MKTPNDVLIDAAVAILAARTQSLHARLRLLGYEEGDACTEDPVAQDDDVRIAVERAEALVRALGDSGYFEP